MAPGKHFDPAKHKRKGKGQKGGGQFTVKAGSGEARSTAQGEQGDVAREDVGLWERFQSTDKLNKELGKFGVSAEISDDGGDGFSILLTSEKNPGGTTFSWNSDDGMSPEDMSEALKSHGVNTYFIGDENDPYLLFSDKKLTPQNVDAMEAYLSRS